MLVNVGDKQYYLDGFLKKNLDYVKQKVYDQNDMFLCLCDGRPGAGKSTLIAQIVYYLSDGKATLDDCCFTMQEFSEKISSASRYAFVWLDEGFELNKRRTQSFANMQMLSVLQRCRSKQIFVFVVLPSFFDLDKNVILGLANVLLHCYRKDFGPRGFFSCYGRNDIKKLWLYCRQNMNYNPKVARPNFKGRFTSFFPFNEREYEKKKDAALAALVQSDAKEEGNLKHIGQRNKLIFALYHKGTPVTEISKTIGVSENNIYKLIQKYDDPSKIEVQK